MRQVALLVAVLTAATLLAGCFSDGFRVTSARDTPEDAPTEAGRGDHALVIHVTEGAGGPPLPGAAVAVSSRDGSALALRTDAAGIAVARLQPDTLAYVSGYLDGYTEEVVEGLALGGAGRETHLEMALYRDTLTYVVDGTLGPVATSGAWAGMTDVEWEPQEVQWGDTPEIRAGYVRRVVAFEATLEWANSPSGGGDLGLGAGTQESSPQVYADANNNVAAGEQKEEVFLGYSDIYDLGWREASTLYVGPGTDSGYVAPIGIGYTMTVTARFEGENSRSQPVPGAEAALLLGAVAGLALLARRRRE